MNAANQLPAALIATFLWIGFVCAISFLEAWLKFRAPGVTLPIGLGIGRLVFNALNKMEWVFSLIIIGNLIISNQDFFTLRNFLFYIPLILLAIQSIWFLPIMDYRAEMHIQNQTVEPSNLHFYYVGFELTKIICLFTFGIKLLKA